MVELTLLAVGLCFVLWPEFASHAFFPSPRPAIVRLLGVAFLLLLAWLIVGRSLN
jgi:hypothetical protein